MSPPVFISYSREASDADAKALAARLDDPAFFDTDAIDDGALFPQCLLDGILDASVVVIFATQAYLARPFCRLEMRLALAGGGSAPGSVHSTPFRETTDGGLLVSDDQGRRILEIGNDGKVVSVITHNHANARGGECW
jgi:TIR domain